VFRSECAWASGEDFKNQLIDGLLKALAGQVFDWNMLIDAFPEGINFFDTIACVLIKVDVHVRHRRVNVFKTLGISLVFELHPVNFPWATCLRKFVKPTTTTF